MSIDDKGLPNWYDAKRTFPPLRCSTEAGNAVLNEALIDKAEDVLDKKLADGLISERTHRGIMAIYTSIRARFKRGHQTLDADIIE